MSGTPKAAAGDLSMAAAANDPPWPDDAVEVARVLGAWGVAGGLKLKAYAADPQALFSTKRWFLQPALPAAGGAVAAPPRRASVGHQPIPRLLRVVKAREQGDSIVATVEDIADRDAAEALKGARVFVSRGSFPTPDADEFYWVDLIGMSVVNRTGQPLGQVVGLLETGPHCVLRIQPAQASEPECLIPFVSVYVDQVDKPTGLITVDWDLDD